MRGWAIPISRGELVAAMVGEMAGTTPVAGGAEQLNYYVKMVGMYMNWLYVIMRSR